jgi:hypothetical protein
MVVAAAAVIVIVVVVVTAAAARDMLRHDSVFMLRLRMCYCIFLQQ